MRAHPICRPSQRVKSFDARRHKRAYSSQQAILLIKRARALPFTSMSSRSLLQKCSKLARCQREEVKTSVADVLFNLLLAHHCRNSSRPSLSISLSLKAAKGGGQLNEEDHLPAAPFKLLMPIRIMK